VVVVVGTIKVVIEFWVVEIVEDSVETPSAIVVS